MEYSGGMGTLDEELLQAAYRGDRVRVQCLLDARADAKAVSPYGETALMGACQYDDTETVRLLIQAGSNVNAVRDTGENLYLRETPLTKAVGYGHAAVVRLLLESGAEFDFFKDDARCLLYAACLSGNAETVELIAGLGAMPPDELPPLSYAIVRNRMDEVQSLLEAGEDPAETDAEGMAPLEWATLFGRLEAAALLEQAGVCVKDCPAALHAAVRGEHVDMCEWLLDRGISVEARDEDDCTPLETAICHNSMQAAECLLQRGANPVAPTSLRQVPLAFAVEMGNLPMVELLLRHGADINAVPYEGGSTALMVAAREDNADMVRFLLEHGADTEVADADEWTALFHAQSAPVARLLLQHGANPHARDIADWTPLQAALKLDKDDALVALLETATKGRRN